MEKEEKKRTQHGASKETTPESRVKGGVMERNKYEDK